jgi:hypothetical protein
MEMKLKKKLSQEIKVVIELIYAMIVLKKGKNCQDKMKKDMKPARN